MNFDARTMVDEFASTYPFPLDDFQRQACEALARGGSVLVCAPTGAGKTVVGEFAVWLALRLGKKAFYTTPLKALSNQKFGDFVALHGAPSVGLLTGDNSIHSESEAVVMTTEVLRNMLYEGSPTLEGLGFVVLDEIHYLKDPYRGGVWEEVLIHLPPGVTVIALSATVPNAEEFGDWLAVVRGGVEVIVEGRRPVPLENHYLVRDKLHDTFVRQRERWIPNPALKRMAEPKYRHGRRPPPARSRGMEPGRVDVVDMLTSKGMVPAIYFIFSRAGCDQAVRQAVASGVRLTNDDEAERIREYVEMRENVLAPEDLETLGYGSWVEALAAGVAAHHAGLIPLFKETVEELFKRGLVKLVFATETLSLGINMPAKTVVLERLIKFTGERHELMTPSDYTQLTGRAGRRGIDPLGHAVVLWQRDVPFDRIASLAGARSEPLTSSFRPSYNMAVNLVRRYSIEEATRILSLSFAQFLSDRAVAGMQDRIERNRRFAEGYAEHLACDRGDFSEYWALVTRARAKEREESERRRTERSRTSGRLMESLQPGDVLALPAGRRPVLAAVVERRLVHGDARMTLLTERERLRRLTPRDLGASTEVVGRISLPAGTPRNPAFKRDVIRKLARLEPTPGARGGGSRGARGGDGGDRRSGAVAEEWARIRAHPCHRCPDRGEHERWAERLDAVRAEVASLGRRVSARTETLARTFERVLGVLRAFGYVEGSAVTPKGERLCRIYNDADLLVSEALEGGALEGLSVPELAAVVSCLVYEPRGFAEEPEWPTKAVRSAFGRIVRTWRAIRRAEEARGVELCREPDGGFAYLMWAWASGDTLEDVLDRTEMSAGDFVRSAKQVWDLLRQLQDAAPEPLAGRCKAAASVIYRGVIAYSGSL